LALFIGIPALIIGFLGINLAGITYNSIPLWEALVVVGAGTLIFASLALLAVARDWRTRAEKQEGGQ
jgi:hypothetical protein